MQLRDIHYVLAAADEGSFSKAAVKVHVSQPALSQLIQRLEDELGVKLFVRKSNRVTLTPAGKIFYEDGKVILALSDQLIHKMNDFQSLKKGELTISVSPFYQKCYLLGVLSEFQKRHFGIKVRIVDAFSSDSETLLVQGQVDLAFVMLPYQNKSIKYERVFEERIFLAVSQAVCDQPEAAGSGRAALYHRGFEGAEGRALCDVRARQENVGKFHRAVPQRGVRAPGGL